MTPSAALELRSLILDVPDYPKPGIVFKDITPLLADPKALAAAIDALAAPYLKAGVKKVAGIESRGFLLAPAVAGRLKAGVVPIRKKGKLPRGVVSESYALEYGTDTLEMHQDALRPGEKVLIIDDVLATGGTAAAACRLAEKLKADIAGVSFLIELSVLKGRDKLKGRRVDSLVSY